MKTYLTINVYGTNDKVHLRADATVALIDSAGELFIADDTLRARFSAVPAIESVSCSSMSEDFDTEMSLRFTIHPATYPPAQPGQLRVDTYSTGWPRTHAESVLKGTWYKVTALALKNLPEVATHPSPANQLALTLTPAPA